jgi:hypothetical protein
MFEATGWIFASGDGEVPVVLRSPAGGQYTLLQRYNFDHTRMTQSVVVRGPDGSQDIFVKGSFEKIGALCRPGSLTAEHGAIARSHAMNGCYVLALASRRAGVAGVEVRSGEEGREEEVRGVGYGRARAASDRETQLRSQPPIFHMGPLHAAPKCTALQRSGAEELDLLRTFGKGLRCWADLFMGPRGSAKRGPSSPGKTSIISPFPFLHLL